MKVNKTSKFTKKKYELGLFQRLIMVFKVKGEWSTVCR